jgi:hypothetical protein
MSIALETLKNLRARGASVQMQDDLASFLPEGYNSPLFLPTIDFILLLQNQAKSQSQEQEQQQSLDLAGFDIPKVYDPSYFDKISLKASGEMIKGAQISKHAQQEILAYLDNMEIQRAKHMGIIGEHDTQLETELKITSRAKISEARRKDRGTGNVKSMFESLVSGLNSLQVSITNAKAQNEKRHQDQVTQQLTIREIIKQKLLESLTKLSGTKSSGTKLGGSKRGFLGDMRRALLGRHNYKSSKNDDLFIILIYWISDFSFN